MIRHHCLHQINLDLVNPVTITMVTRKLERNPPHLNFKGLDASHRIPQMMISMLLNLIEEMKGHEHEHTMVLLMS